MSVGTRDLRARALFLSLAVGSTLGVAPAFAESAPASAAKRGDGRRIMEAGKKAFAQKNYDAAAKLFQSAFEADPSLTLALYNRAFALRKGERYAEAAVAYREFLAVVPGDLDALYGLAEAERLAGENDAAKQHFSEYIAKENRPKRAAHVDRAREQLAGLGEKVAPDLDARFATGMKLHREKKYREAATVFAEVYGLDDTRTDALYREALALRRAGDLPEAGLAYKKFLKFVPDDPDATYGLAETERLNSNAKEAIRHFERYIQIEKRPSEAQYVERAKQYIKLLRGVPEEKAPPVAAAVPPPPATPPVVAPAPDPAPPVVATTEPSPVVDTPPAATPAPVVEPKPVVEPAPPAVVTEATGPATIPSIPGHGPSPSHAAVLGRALGVRKLVKEGRAALQLGDAERAQERFALAAAMAPDDEAVSAARDAVAFARANKGNTSANASGDAGLDALLQAGDEALQDGKVDEAVTHYQRARAVYPGSARPLWALARAYETRGDARGARHHYQLYVAADAPDKEADKVSEARWKLAQP